MSTLISELGEAAELAAREATRQRGAARPIVAEQSDNLREALLARIAHIRELEAEWLKQAQTGSEPAAICLPAASRLTGPIPSTEEPKS